MTDYPPPSMTVTYKWADGEPIYGEFGWMDTEHFATDADLDEPREYLEERWERTAVAVLVAYPLLYSCTYEDQEPCEEDAVAWQREDDVWMQACPAHAHEETTDD